MSYSCACQAVRDTDLPDEVHRFPVFAGATRCRLAAGGFILLAVFIDQEKIKFEYEISSDNIKFNYGLLRDMNVMVFIGFGMLHSLLRRNAWTSITMNTLMLALSVQYALFFNFLWERAFKEDWKSSNLDFNFIINAIFISSSVLISLGCVLGKNYL